MKKNLSLFPNGFHHQNEEGGKICIRTKCKQCGRIFDTEERYYSFVCGECTERLRKSREKDPEAEYAEDKAILEGLRRDLDDAIANGESPEVIRTRTLFYDRWVDYMERHYGSA